MSIVPRSCCRSFSYGGHRITYKSGVTLGVVAPKARGFLSGLSTVFSTGARLDDFRQDVAALHVNVQNSGGTPSVSTQIATLRRLLQGHGKGELGVWFSKVIEVGGLSIFGRHND